MTTVSKMARVTWPIGLWLKPIFKGFASGEKKKNLTCYNALWKSPIASQKKNILSSASQLKNIKIFIKSILPSRDI